MLRPRGGGAGLPTLRCGLYIVTYFQGGQHGKWGEESFTEEIPDRHRSQAIKVNITGISRVDGVCHGHNVLRRVLHLCSPPSHTRHPSPIMRKTPQIPTESILQNTSSVLETVKVIKPRKSEKLLSPGAYITLRQQDD